MTGVELTLLLVAWMIAGGSPGPATLAIAGTSMNQGRKLGLVFSCGILAGSAFWGIAAALGMSAVMMANAWIFTTLKYLGAAYLLYLAVKSLRSAFQEKSTLMKRGHQGSVPTVFLKGTLIHLTNPKAILGWGAVYAIALPVGASVGQVFAMFAFLYAGSITVFIGYAFIFSTSGVVNVYAKLRRWFDLVFAALFGAASLRILTVRVE